MSFHRQYCRNIEARSAAKRAVTNMTSLVKRVGNGQNSFVFVIGIRGPVAKLIRDALDGAIRVIRFADI